MVPRFSSARVFLLVAALLVTQMSTSLASSSFSSSSNNKNVPTTTTLATFSRPVVYLVGDSMTELGFAWGNGWGLQLTRRLLRRADVLNRGLSGYNSRSFRALLLNDNDEDNKNDHKILQQQQYYGAAALRGVQPNTFLLPSSATLTDFCIVFLGTNDSNHATPSHVPLDEFEDNLYHIASTLLQRSRSGLLLVTPTPCHVPHFQEWLREYLQILGVPASSDDEQDLDPEQAQAQRTAELIAYGRAVHRVAERLQTDIDDDDSNNNNPKRFVKVVDAFQAFTREFGDCASRNVLVDGLHFGPKGHDLLVQEIWKALRSTGHDEEEDLVTPGSKRASELWNCPPLWSLDEVGARSARLPRSEPSYLDWWAAAAEAAAAEQESTEEEQTGTNDE